MHRVQRVCAHLQEEKATDHDSRRARRIVVRSVPEGQPVPDNFEMVSEELPSLADGEMLLRTRYCSIDPYMRTIEGIANPESVGKTMVGGTLSEVMESRAEGWSVGDLVVGYYGWQDLCIAHNSDVQWGHPEIPIERWEPSLGPPSTALGVLGMTGYTAYFGLLEIGQPKPGETVVVSAASGAVGQVVGQIAKSLGCYVVGVAGGKPKCDFCVEDLGFDKCVDYKAGNLPSTLAAACPNGIDVYFENVGGEVLEAVLPLLNKGCRVPVCGFVSQYNVWNQMTHPAPMQRLKENGVPKMPKEGGREGFRFFFWMEPSFLLKRAEALSQLSAWLKEGKIKYRESTTFGLDTMVSAFSGMLRGENFGKAIVKLT